MIVHLCEPYNSIPVCARCNELNARAPVTPRSLAIYTIHPYYLLRGFLYFSILTLALTPVALWYFRVAHEICVERAFTGMSMIIFLQNSFNRFLWDRTVFGNCSDWIWVFHLQRRGSPGEGGFRSPVFRWQVFPFGRQETRSLVQFSGHSLWANCPNSSGKIEIAVSVELSACLYSHAYSTNWGLAFVLYVSTPLQSQPPPRPARAATTIPLLFAPGATPHPAAKDFFH